jgi:hypothetical protein
VKDTTAKLAACEASLKRWQTRLKRATTKVTELDRQRRRLQAKMGPVSLTNLIGPPMSDKDVGADQETVKPLIQHDDLAHMPSNAKKDIPDFLDRSNPLIAEQMTAARKKAEAAARSAMPLTGRAAQDFIKSRRKKA